VPYTGGEGCVACATQKQSPPGAVTADTYLDASSEGTDPAVQAGSYSAHRDPYDPAGQERWDTWFNTSMGCTRELYWDDAVSLGLKYDLINRTNLRGVGLWNLNYGGGAPELWNALATHFALVPGQPGNLNACAGDSRVTVSWTAAPTTGGPVTSYQVTASPGGASVNVPTNVTLADMMGLTPGTAYTFTVQAINAGGAGVGATTSPATPTGPPVATSYLTWYDKASAGMVSDNIHLLNPGGASASVTVSLPGASPQSVTVAAGGGAYVTFPRGTIGGPVTVTSTQPVIASQRVQFNSTFNE